MKKPKFTLKKIKGLDRLFYGANKKALQYKNSFVSKVKTSLDDENTDDEETPIEPEPTEPELPIVITEPFVMEMRQFDELELVKISEITVDWGDGTINNETTHKYANNTNTYRVSIIGNFHFGQPKTLNNNGLPESPYYVYYSSRSIDIKILNWGGYIVSGGYEFSCLNKLDLTEVGIPNIQTNHLEYLFAATELIVDNLDGWVTDQIVDIRHMFDYNHTFNGSLDWDTSNVTTMVGVFFENFGYNHPLNWDTSKVTDMRRMFQTSQKFNQPLRFSNASNPDITDMLYAAGAMTYQVEWYQ